MQYYQAVHGKATLSGGQPHFTSLQSTYTVEEINFQWVRCCPKVILSDTFQQGGFEMPLLS